MISSPIADSRFRLTESVAVELANIYGTPLYVVDEAHFRTRIRTYLNAFRAAYAKSEISLASKANSTMALVKIAYQEGCTIDVASEGELRVALAAGVPGSKCHLHGNNKQRDELQFALDNGIGHIVADNFDEIELLDELLVGELKKTTKIVLRLAPGVDPATHAKNLNRPGGHQIWFQYRRWLGGKGCYSLFRARIQSLRISLPRRIPTS